MTGQSRSRAPQVRILTGAPSGGDENAGQTLDLRGPRDGAPEAIGRLVAALHGGASTIITNEPVTAARAVDVYLAILAGEWTYGARHGAVRTGEHHDEGGSEPA